VRGPDRGVKVCRQYLYPSELLQLATSPHVREDWTRAIVIGIYTYCRVGELRALTWDDVDLEHRTITVSS
jgi:integrase